MYVYIYIYIIYTLRFSVIGKLKFLFFLSFHLDRNRESRTIVYITISDFKN